MYASTYQQSTGRTARPGGTIGQTVGYVVHTEAGAALPASATLAQERARVRAIDAYHRSLGWGGAGYSAASAASGRVHEMRGWWRSGAHTVGWNTTRHAIVQLGHGDRTPLTEIQIVGIRRWADEGVRVGALRRSPTVTGHRDHLNPVTKSCPGNRVYPQLHRLRAGASAPTPSPPPASSGDLLEEIARMTPAQRQQFIDDIARGVAGYRRRDGEPDLIGAAVNAHAHAKGANEAVRDRNYADDTRRVRLSLRAIGRRLGIKVNVNGTEGEDIIA